MEQSNNRMIPDILMLQIEPKPPSGRGGVELLSAKPKTNKIERSDEEVYADKADRIIIHDEDGTMVSAIVIVSPGNKHSKVDFRDFTDKTVR